MRCACACACAQHARGMRPSARARHRARSAMRAEPFPPNVSRCYSTLSLAVASCGQRAVGAARWVHGAPPAQVRTAKAARGQVPLAGTRGRARAHIGASSWDTACVSQRPPTRGPTHSLRAAIFEGPVRTADGPPAQDGVERGRRRERCACRAARYAGAGAQRGARRRRSSGSARRGAPSARARTRCTTPPTPTPTPPSAAPQRQQLAAHGRSARRQGVRHQRGGVRAVGAMAEGRGMSTARL